MFNSGAVNGEISVEWFEDEDEDEDPYLFNDELHNPRTDAHTHTRLWSVWLHFFSIVFVSGLNTVHMNQLLHVNTAWWDDNIRFLIRCKPGEIHCELLAVTVLDSAATRERATVAVSMRKKMA